MNHHIKKLLFTTLVFFISSALVAQIHVVWQIETNQMWERDWLMELLHGLEFDNIYDSGKFEQLVDNSIIVVSVPRNNKRAAYFKKLRELNYKFGVIQLSDEGYNCPTDFYADAQFVFRNYWHPQFINQKNVVMFSLGYKSGFWAGKSQPVVDCTHRKYTWSFAGEINGKPTRSLMLSQLRAIANHHVHEISCGTDPNSLSTTDYQNLLLNSIFVPCPAGWNMDTFRIWEALECGCIPVVEKFPVDYFGLFLGKHPFLAVHSWEQAAQEIKDLLANPEQLEARRQECYRWWLEYKKQMNKTFVTTIKKTLS